MSLLAGVVGGVTLASLAQTAAGWLAVRQFAGRPRLPATERPPISVLKPLYGAEPLLEDALASLCVQDYPVWQVVFGVQNPADPALAIARQLQQRFPATDIAVVVDPRLLGPNRKVGNLINMLPAAKHDVLVIADSDLHVAPDYLDRLAAALAGTDSACTDTTGTDPTGTDPTGSDTTGTDSRTGLVCTLYAGLPAERRLAGLLGTSHITHGFLPGALLSRAIGRQDSLGATMLLRRATLARIGGFEALLDHLADDNALGRLILGLGLSIRLADTVPLTTVPENSLRALFRHELRWARTIRALVPAQFAAAMLQYPLAWALLAVLLSQAATWAVALFAAAWAIRAACACGIDRALGLASIVPLWLLPARDLMSVAVMIASYGSRRVDWRGQQLQADGPAQVTRPATDAAQGELSSR